MREIPCESPSLFVPCHRESRVSQANDTSDTLVPHANADTGSSVAALSHTAVDVSDRDLVAAELSRRDEEMLVVHVGHFQTHTWGSVHFPALG